MTTFLHFFWSSDENIVEVKKKTSHLVKPVNLGNRCPRQHKQTDTPAEILWDENCLQSITLPTTSHSSSQDVFLLHGRFTLEIQRQWQTETNGNQTDNWAVWPRITILLLYFLGVKLVNLELETRVLPAHVSVKTQLPKQETINQI